METGNNPVFSETVSRESDRLLRFRSLAAKEVADVLRLDLSTVYKLIRDKELPAKRVGGRWRIRESDLEKWFGGED